MTQYDLKCRICGHYPMQYHDDAQVVVEGVDRKKETRTGPRYKCPKCGHRNILLKAHS